MNNCLYFVTNTIKSKNLIYVNCEEILDKDSKIYQFKFDKLNKFKGMIFKTLQEIKEQYPELLI